MTVSLARNPSGEPQYFIGIIQDISDRKRSEQQLQSEKLRLQLALEAMEMGTWESNLDTGIWSARTEAIFGYEPGAFASDHKAFLKLVHLEDQERVFQSLHHSFTTHSPYNTQKMAELRSAIFWVLCPKQSLHCYICDVMGDGTFQNIVKPRFDRCLTGETTDYGDWFYFMKAGNRFVSATYSPYFEVDGSITGVVISNRDVTARREAEISLQDSEERLRLALTAANQGLYDLNPQIDNAYDAMRSKQMQLSEDDLRPSTYIPSLTVSTQLVEDKVEIRIRDNGCGLAPQIRSKILDPFFTTKPPGEGTGLGLSLTHDIIVKQHQGTLTINSELNEFTEFLLSIPIHSPNMQSFVLK